MAGILTSDLEETTNSQRTPLVVEECLGEFNDGQKTLARENLDVYDRASVYTQKEVEERLSESIKSAFDKYLGQDDPPITEELARQIIEESVKDFVTKDQQFQFLKPAREYTDVQLTSHLGKKDPHQIIPQVQDMLEQYARWDEVYLKSQLYNKGEIESQAEKYIKKDGSTPFTKAQIGADPQIDSHLATKRYVDKVNYNHLVEVDPHGFTALLNKRLALYAKASNVYDKSKTYSRDQLDSIIRSLVNDAAKESIIDHLNEFDPHNVLSEVRKERYIKQDGTIPFRAPQKGVDAVDPQDLVTLAQLEENTRAFQQKLDEKQCTWITSGPAEATVGNINIDTDLPATMSVQEVLDAIFYGQSISIHVPEYNNIATECVVKVCIHGSAGLVQLAELYQDNILIASFEKEDFDNDRCTTILSSPIVKDTDFTFRVTYVSGAIHEETKTVKCSFPIFIGLLPKWKFGNTITYQYLQEQVNSDGINNRFYHEGGKEFIINHKYNFTDKSLMHLMAVVPESYPDLDQMRIPSQQFGKEAFDIIDMIPLQIPGVEGDTIYKIYIYRQALYTANQETIFKFKNNE